MEKKKFSVNGLVLCLFELVVGVLLILNPELFTRTIVMGAGVVLLVVGIINIVMYFKAEPEVAAQGQGLVLGLGALIGGLLCILGNAWIIKTFSAFTVIYGVFILVTGLSKVQTTVDMLRTKRGKWLFPAIGAAVSIICAIIIISNPFEAVNFIWTFIGVTLLVQAAFDIMTIITKNKAKAEN